MSHRRKRPRSKGRRTAASKRPLTVEMAVQAYLRDREAEGQDIARAAQQLAAHVLPRWGRCAISELTVAELRKWRDELAAAAPRRRRPRAARAPELTPGGPTDPHARRKRRSTVNRIMTVFKAALNHAARLYPEQCGDGAAPWREGLRSFRNVDAPRERWLERDDAARLLRACDPDFRALVQAALYTGCRYGELCRATVGDYRRSSQTLRIAVSKSGRWRDVILHEEAAAFFDALTHGRESGEPLLRRRDGKPWGRGHQVRPMSRACRLAGIRPPVSFHGLRHTYASLAVQSGMALIALARNLGHADTRMVERHYGHLSDRYMREQVQRFAPAFAEVRGPKS